MKSFFENVVSQARAAIDPKTEHERQQRRNYYPPIREQHEQEPLQNQSPQPPPQPQKQQPIEQPQPQQVKQPLVPPRLLQDSVVVLKEHKYASIDNRRAKVLAEDTLSLIELIFDHSRAHDIELNNFLAAHGHLDTGESERQTKQVLRALCLSLSFLSFLFLSFPSFHPLGTEKKTNKQSSMFQIRDICISKEIFLFCLFFLSQGNRGKHSLDENCRRYGCRP